MLHDPGGILYFMNIPFDDHAIGRVKNLTITLFVSNMVHGDNMFWEFSNPGVNSLLPGLFAILDKKILGISTSDLLPLFQVFPGQPLGMPFKTKEESSSKQGRFFAKHMLTQCPMIGILSILEIFAQTIVD